MPGLDRDTGGLDEPRITNPALPDVEEAPMRIETYTIHEARQILGIGRNLAYRMAKTGTLPTVRFGKAIRVPKLALEKLLSGEDVKARFRLE